MKKKSSSTGKPPSGAFPPTNWTRFWLLCSTARPLLPQNYREGFARGPRRCNGRMYLNADRAVQAAERGEKVLLVSQRNVA